MKITKRLSLPDYITAGLLVVYLVIGLRVSADYGVNWDDDVQRINGLTNWEFITGKNTQHLREASDRYHGPAFEIFLIAVEKSFHLTGYRDIFLARHRCVFLFFVVGAGIFFLLTRRLFNNAWLALLAMLMLILSPRTFGESFYNPKDIPVLVAMVLALYSLLLLCAKPSYLHTLFHAFTCAFAIDIRIVCIVLLPATFFMAAICIYQYKIDTKGLWKKILVFTVAQFGLMVLMWPILATGPFVQLWYAYKQLSYYNWTGLNRYMGESMSAMHTPWHYHWVWLLISLPEVYILLFIAGSFILFRQALKISFFMDFKKVFLALSLSLFLFPLIFRSISGSTVLDGWRHVYFVYPILVLLAVYAVEQSIIYSDRVVRSSILVLLFIQMVDSCIQIIAMHPFEYVYFNHTANAVFKPIDRSFEMDYWGLSYKQGYEYIISHFVQAQKVKVAYKNFPGIANYNFLTSTQKEKIEPVDFNDAKYFLTNNRDEAHRISPVIPGRLVYEFHAQGNRILSIYKVR
jgi:hypothetical protein